MANFKSRPKLLGLLAIVIVTLSLIGAVYLKTPSSKKTQPTTPTPTISTTISQNELEEKYGLRVMLVAVTGAGGFVDLRLKVVDTDKAGQLLNEPAKMPVLYIKDNGWILKQPADAQNTLPTLEKDALLLGLFPNSLNAVQPGTSVTLIFGDVAVEPIVSQ